MVGFLESFFYDFIWGETPSGDFELVAIWLTYFLSFCLVISFFYMGLKLVFPNVSKYRNIIFIMIYVFVFIYCFLIILGVNENTISEYISAISNIGNTQTLAQLGGV